MIFIGLLVVPLLVAGSFFILTKHAITWKEFLSHIGISTIVATVSVAILHYSNTADIEIWGGHVRDKQRERVHCRHSYPCNCRQVCSGTGQSSVCSTVCDTCYRHSFDYDWAVYSTDGGRIRIKTLDSQGLRKPPRWTAVKIGEPSASAHIFTNYIKGASDSLFSYQGLVEKYKGMLPPYPGTIYDYYRVNRLVTVGVKVKDVERWNDELMRWNDALGALKQVVLGIVIVKAVDMDYFNALQQHWVGGKKNDFILVMSVDGDKILWAEVMAWSVNKVAEVEARDAVMQIGRLEYNPGSEPDAPSEITTVMAAAVKKSFVRKPMEDFEYLSSSVQPTWWQFIIAFVLNVALSVLAGYIFHANDITEHTSSRERGMYI